ncbi:4-coumarate--CoA ligase 1 [Eumeta japonica]|uniref:4-coumarate--CoA ligase 1 n=1 Tax=Eumeta variegata TaxID=151549 RepID=A0A4C1ZM46_EUMVA|nr:4-coumarate--CoA ligase 1 [Eumeta japonica]
MRGSTEIKIKSEAENENRIGIYSDQDRRRNQMGPRFELRRKEIDIESRTEIRIGDGCPPAGRRRRAPKMNATKRLFSELRLIKGKTRVNYSVVPKNLSREEHVIRSTLPDVVIPNTDFLDRLWRDSAVFRKLVAIVSIMSECAETKKKYTYEQLWDLSARWATVLQRLDAGDTVAVMLPNCPEFPVLALGALQAGRKVTTLNPIYKEFEITHQLKLTQPTVIMTNNDCYDTITKALALINQTAKILIVDKPAESIPAGAIRYSEVVENSKIDISTLQKVRTKAEDTAFLPFSSGTTGLPKGVEISYKNLLATLEMTGHEKVCLPNLASESFQDVVPCILPFFHIYGLVVALLGHLTKGCKLVTLPKFSVDLYLDVLKNQKATLLYVVPPIVFFYLLEKVTKKEMKDVFMFTQLLKIRKKFLKLQDASNMVTRW